MKFKKLAKSVAAIMLGATVGVSAFAFVGCKDDNNTEVPPIVINEVTISVSLDKTEIMAGSTDTVQATATVENTEDKSVVWSVSGSGKDYVDINVNTGAVTLKRGLYPQTEVEVTVTATLAANAGKTAYATLKIKPLVITGEVNDLKTEMFEALGNPAITVTGEVTDVYDDLTAANRDVQEVYDFKVMMSDGAWYGEWNKKGMDAKDVSNYRRSAETISGTDRHAFNEVYINKNNEVAQKTVTDYNSIAAVWEEQHLYNHIAQLGTDIENWWKYDSVNGVYVYQFDNESMEDLYLRTYLAFSLTPMLGNSDTLENIFLTVEKGENDEMGRITKLQATTSMYYQGGQEEGSSDGATSVSYTILTANFSDVGTTVVPDPTPYEADYKADVLANAIKNMGDATNYTFSAKETTISAPSYDEGDYSEYSVSTYRTSAANTKSSTGTEGLVGKVTEDAILLAKTGKYTAGMDDNLYWTDYSGYKQISETAYDFFEYNYDLGALAGTRRYQGNIFDKMPKFDFSENLFEFADTKAVRVGNTWKEYPVFVLREPAITRDIALEVSAHSYATDATGATYGSLRIIVNPDTERIYSIEYPYSLVSGTYLGMIETTFSDIGSTTLPEDTFEGYQERVVPTNWSQMNVKYYHPDHTTTSPYVPIDAGTLLTNIFGAEANKMPTPDVFVTVFGDTLAGPFFDWTDDDKTATGGTVTHYDWMSTNVQVDECDENGKISDKQYKDTIDALTVELAKKGFTKSVADSQTTYYGTSYAVYTNGSIMIKVENMRTRFFYISFLPSEIWWHFNPDLLKAPTEK